MKKLTTLLIILTLITAGVFAVDNASFDLTTTVAAINAMKITAAQFSGTTVAALTSATGVTTPYNVATAGAQSGFSGYLSTLSNKRTGYYVMMSATAMTSTVGQVSSYINYTVTVDNKSITTNGATTVTPVKVVDVSSLTAITPNSQKITLNVDSTSFNAAVEGQYTGTVTFTYTAN